MTMGQSDYMEYYSLINQADFHFGKEQFDRALSMYDSAFQKVEQPFVQDYLMAAKITTIADSKSRTSKYLEQATRAGYPCDCIEKMPIFSDFIKSDDWRALKSKEAEFRAKYVSQISVSLNIEFSIRYRNEQDTKSHVNRTQYVNHVKSNYSRIKFLIDSLGFPSERIIGLDDGKIAPNRINQVSGLSSCSAGNSKVIATLLHYDNPITDIGIEKFITAIEKGLLHPRQFAYIFTFEKHFFSRINKSRSINPPHLPAYDFNFAFGKKIEDKDKVNIDRARFGICSLQIEENKKRVARKYKIQSPYQYW